MASAAANSSRHLPSVVLTIGPLVSTSFGERAFARLGPRRRPTTMKEIVANAHPAAQVSLSDQRAAISDQRSSEILTVQRERSGEVGVRQSHRPG
jgi:hypothetical protein